MTGNEFPSPTTPLASDHFRHKTRLGLQTRPSSSAFPAPPLSSSTHPAPSCAPALPAHSRSGILYPSSNATVFRPTVVVGRHTQLQDTHLRCQHVLDHGARLCKPGKERKRKGSGNREPLQVGTVAEAGPQHRINRRQRRVRGIDAVLRGGAK